MVCGQRCTVSIAVKRWSQYCRWLWLYEHGETPGLGGEVDNPKWRDLWLGKNLFDDKDKVAIRVIKGNVDKSSPTAVNQADGLAGATLTSNGVTHLVQFWLGENGFGSFIEHLRAGEA